MAGLRELRDALRAERKLSLQTLALRSGSSTSAVEAMLVQWERKGRVVRHGPTDCGGGGSCCCAKNCPSAVVYEWVAE
ncbi:FeoC-like transcriptional regulator [Breoghania corrubedonensis]|uniref:FeoC-like transcriptional regulator n=1 Tax=Breoghania corrubedonensis TaxID=665038 RepID=A0A2T5V9Z0_9HYPH|nr:FeoC-like transcriptional regulator [Breoghania corrubedonensis]PTW60568.1 FeoC-like transcriptional regulator [Breoghania corrubedonensis]